MAEQRKRILIVDDAGLVRRYYRDALEGAGFDVSEALNGLEALETLMQDQFFDLLVVDINMPQMDGLTFITRLRAMEMPMAGIPALVTSTESQPQDREAARRAGANFYLPKPVNQDVLADYVSLMSGAAR